jgi:hypothetical protein
MSALWFFIIIGFLLLLLAVIGVIAFVDWRALIVRRYGPDYRKGLAHIQVNGVWIYRASALIYEGADAMTYSRQVDIAGKPGYVEDIVPNAIGFSFDEYTGARMYRVQPGGCIGYSDDGNAPAVDYPAELISVHVLDRTASSYAASVNAESDFNWKPFVIAGIAAVIVILVILFSTGTLKLPGMPAPGTEPPAQTQTVPATENQTGPVIGGQ